MAKRAGTVGRFITRAAIAAIDGELTSLGATVCKGTIGRVTGAGDVTAIIIQEGEAGVMMWPKTAQAFINLAPWIPHIKWVVEDLLDVVEDELVTEPCMYLSYFYDRQSIYSESLPWSKRAFEVVRDRFGIHHPRTIEAMTGLAVEYMSRRRDDEAEKLYKEVLAIKRSCLLSTDPKLIPYLNNIAFFYSNEDGVMKYETAKPFYKEVAKISRIYLPATQKELYFSLINLARIYRRQHSYSALEEVQEESLAVTRATVPRDPSLIRTAIYGLASLYQEQGKYDKAIVLYEEYMAMLNEDSISELPYMGSASHKLGKAYKVKGRYSKAEFLFQRVLEFTLKEPNRGRSIQEKSRHERYRQELIEEVVDFYREALAAGLPDIKLRQHLFGAIVLDRLQADATS